MLMAARSGRMIPRRAWPDWSDPRSRSPRNATPGVPASSITFNPIGARQPRKWLRRNRNEAQRSRPHARARASREIALTPPPRPKRASRRRLHADARFSRKAGVAATPAARRLRGLLRHPGHLLAAAALRDSSGSSATSIPYPKAPPRPRRSGVRRWPPVGLNVVALSGQRFPTTPARRARTSGAPCTGGDVHRPDVVVLLVGDPGPVG